MRYHFFLHYGWFFQNLGKEGWRTFMHTTVTKCCKARIAHWLRQLLRPVAAIKIHTDCAVTADYEGIGEWAKLNLQSIQEL